MAERLKFPGLFVAIAAVVGLVAGGDVLAALGGAVLLLLLMAGIGFAATVVDHWGRR